MNDRARCPVGVIILWIFVVMCSSEDDRQETLGSLRGIGASTSQVASEPSTETRSRNLTLTLWIALPAGVDIDRVKAFLPKDIGFFALMPEKHITVDETAGENYTDFPGFRVASIGMNITVPTQNELDLFLSGKSFEGVQVRYGVEVSGGGSSELIVGNFWVFPGGSPELQWEQITATEGTPLSGEEVPRDSDISLKASASNPNDELIKFGWFTTKGKIINRRSVDTIWRTPKEGGEVVLLHTARGKTSKSFAWTPITVIVN